MILNYLFVNNYFYTFCIRTNVTREQSIAIHYITRMYRFILFRETYVLPISHVAAFFHCRTFCVLYINSSFIRNKLTAAKVNGAYANGSCNYAIQNTCIIRTHFVIRFVNKPLNDIIKKS